jgi:hypothetical protein
VLSDYARALDQYDHQRLLMAPEMVTASETETFELTPESARQAINALRMQFGVASCLAARKASRSKARCAQSIKASVRRICVRA